MKKIKFLKIGLLLFIFLLGTYSCKKQGVENEKTGITSKMDIPTADQKLVSYLSITLGVKPNEVEFIKSENNFNVRGIKFNKDSVESRYSRANEYKLNYEHQ